MVHVMALQLFETCSFGIHFISFTCIIPKILPNNFFLLLNPDFWVLSAHIYY